MSTRANPPASNPPSAVATAAPSPAAAPPTPPPVDPAGAGRSNGGRPALVARAASALGRPGAPTRLVMTLLLVGGALWASGAGPYVQLIGQSCAIFGVAAIGQSLLVGGAGQVALSGGAFMATGAFTAGILVDHGFDNFLLVLLVTAGVGWVVGVVSGLPGLRFRGLYLLLASLALQFIVQSLAKQFQAAHHPAGMVIPPLSIAGHDLSFGTNLYWTLIVILIVVYAVSALVERTGVGLAWRALRESEVAAAMSGVDVVRWKLYAFAASGAVTSMAGCLFAYWVGRADYEAYSLNLSITLISMIYIGGVRSRLGAVVGAAIITVLPYFLQSQVSVWLVDSGISFDWYLNNVSTVNAGLFSLLFLVVILFEPRGVEGVLSRVESLARKVAHRRAGRTGVEA